nr:reverse transcriptase domain-containing protein [Tanacetum cinerariifolium]
MLVPQGEGLGTPTEPHHTPSLESSALPSIADKPASPLRDVSQGEACPTDYGFVADQDRANIAKTSTLPYDTEPRVTSPTADEGSMQQTLDELTALCTSLQRQHSEMVTKFEAHELKSTGGVAKVPTGSGSIPTACPLAAEVLTGSDVVLTAGLIFATATVVTPYTRRKGKETMVESETLKKKKVQEQIDAQVARELEKQMERKDQRMFEQIARDAEIARIHAEEELQIMIDGLDRNNEIVVNESFPNPTSLNPKLRNRRRSKEPFILEESLNDTMADQRTMEELLRAPTEGYAEEIVFDESFHEAWDRYKDLLRVCPHHGFTELHQLDTFYNALNPTDQDSLNSAADGNLLETRTQDVLPIIENKSKVRNSRHKSIVSQVKSSDANSSSSSEIAKLTCAVNQQTFAVTTTITAILKQFQATPPPAFVKVIEEICVTCGGAHPYYQCLAADGNTFPEFRDNIQGYVLAAAVDYNQAITTRSGLVLDRPSVPMPLPFMNLEEDERVEETLTDPKLGEYTIKVPPPLVQKAKPPSQRNYVDKRYWGDEDPFGAPHNFFEKEQCNLHSSGFSFILVVGTFFTGSGNFSWQWELHNW